LSTLEPFEVFATPITIAVISDTHLTSRPRSLPPELTEVLRSADLILHAGDFCSVEAYEMIGEYGELRGVSGNNDAAELFRRLPMRRTFRFGDFTAGMIHGHNFDDLTARQAAKRELAGRVDLAIFGHSHKSYCRWHEKTLLFNPGSPTHRRWEPKSSYGIIRIDKHIDAELLFLHG
jgi:uncharacterized protein